MDTPRRRPRYKLDRNAADREQDADEGADGYAAKSPEENDFRVSYVLKRIWASDSLKCRTLFAYT